jgi:hypothetical protein
MPDPHSTVLNFEPASLFIAIPGSTFWTLKIMFEFGNAMALINSARFPAGGGKVSPAEITAAEGLLAVRVPGKEICAKRSSLSSARPAGNLPLWRMYAATVHTRPYPEAHFATFPPALVDPCIKVGSNLRELILDPFVGSGTTGLVALKLNRRFVGIELNPSYLQIAESRLNGDLIR